MSLTHRALRELSRHRAPRPARALSLALAATITTVAAASSTVAGCAATPDARRYSRGEAQEALTRLETPGLVIGEFTLARGAVLDGDTIRVRGLDTTMRLLAIDTEETFKNEADRRAMEAGFDDYMRDKRGGGKRPPKAATPMGEAAKRWAKAFFADVRTIRLERDHPKEIRGRYNRYLAYVMAEVGGKWVNYNVEAVRAGMSPYFTKYGYSRRFHAEFVAAEAEARAARRGIWDPTSQGYGDYDQRKAWWDARADFIQTFEREAEGRDDFIVLTNWDAPGRLEGHEGREVTVLAAVSRVIRGDRGPTRVLLSRRQFQDFPLIFFDKDVFGSSGIAGMRGEYVRVRGRVSKYFNKRRKQTELQIVVNLPGQITGAPAPARVAGSERDPSPQAEPPQKD